MSKHEILKAPTCTLRVNIHCDGCKHKVKKILQKVEGVYGVKIDAESGKVTVTGNADPATLIKKLESSGKHAELCSSHNKGNKIPFNMMNNQFMNLELGDFKGGKDLKSHSKGGSKDPKKGAGHMMQNPMKGSVPKGGPPKNQKSVKFDLPDDEFDELDDFDDEDDDDFDDDDDDDVSDDERDGCHHHAPSKSKMMSLMGGKGGKGSGGGKGGKGSGGKGGGGGFSGMMNMLKGGAGKKSGGKPKKGGEEFEIPVHFKGMNGGNHNEGSKKSSNGEKNGKVGYQIHGGGGGASGGKMSNGKGGGGGHKGGDNNWGQQLKGGGQQMMNNNMQMKGFQEGAGGGRGGMSQMGPMSQMRPMGQMGNYPMGQMGNMAAVQGHPAAAAMKGGSFPGMGGPQGGNPYQNPQHYQHQQQQQQQYMAQQQQQYMAQMMMNQYQQQRPSGYDMYGGGGGPHPMMYAPQPHPGMGYGPPMHPPVNDNFTHMFSDENTDSCSVM
ncbi:unnamed protein product [Cuscuta europaea]|uniref:HMA domain-containing protein n=1 Tax=Cuscuta europaea TaxID=41803 RepID=A0A9P0Z2W1_CUSEU|nr:unnamed protein product [Cuscuta europaea]